MAMHPFRAGLGGIVFLNKEIHIFNVVKMDKEPEKNPAINSEKNKKSFLLFSDTVSFVPR